MLGEPQSVFAYRAMSEMRPTKVCLDYLDAVEGDLRDAGSHCGRMHIVLGVVANILAAYPSYTIAKIGGCRYARIGIRPREDDYVDFELAFGVGRHFYTDKEAIDGENQGMRYLQGRPDKVCDNKNRAALGGRFTKEDGTE